MKEIKIGYISDEHIDFYCKEKNIENPKFSREIQRFIEKNLNPEGGDILLSAGDTGHFNAQTQEYLLQMLNYYDDICLVNGNHDLYLINGSQRDKYKLNSFNRTDEMKQWCQNQSNIHYLDGDVIDIKGIQIGGLGNWYDLPSRGNIEQWTEVMNDANLIMQNTEPYKISYAYGATKNIPSFDTQKYRQEMEEKMKSIIFKGCDVLLTHVIPVIIPDEAQGQFLGDRNNIFYMTDDMDNVLKTKAKIVIYGHNHSTVEFSQKGVEFKTNALGYPAESCAQKIEHFNFNPKS